MATQTTEAESPVSETEPVATFRPASPTHDMSAQRRKVRGSFSERAVGLAEPMSPRGLLLALLRRWKFALTIALPIAAIVVALALKQASAEREFAIFGSAAGRDRPGGGTGIWRAAIL